MNSLKLNIDTPTENVDSELISETSVDSVNQNGGAFGFDLFFGRRGSSADDIVISAAKDKQWDVVKYLISKNMITSLRTKDENGNNLLHLIALGFPSEMNELIATVLNISDAKSALNAKNKEGNTPLHIAVQSGNNQLAGLMIEKGADPNIRNGQGLRVAESEETEDINVSNTVITLDPAAQAVVMNRILAMLGRNSSSAVQDTQSEVELPKSLSEVQTEAPSSRSLLDLLTEEPKQTGGADVIDTDAFIDNLVHKYGNQSGGLRVHGVRRLPDMHEGGLKKKKATKNVSRGDQLSRLINNQASEIHKNVVKKIMELMEVEEEAARDYKAALWRMVKEKNPDMKSNLDLSVEMEKLVKKPTLKKIDLAEAKSFREESRKRREERKTSSPKTTEKESDQMISSTSETGLSSTSEGDVDLEEVDFLSATSY